MTTGNPIFRGCSTHKLAGSCAKLDVYDWLKDIINTANPDEFVEIRFKNTRKDYYRNVNGLSLEVGELVAVEGNPGHDIGMVSLTGDLVLKQMKRHKVTLNNGEIRKVYRKVKPVDVEKWEAAMSQEHQTMIKSRQIAADLKLNMKIGDVEYQGDGTKAIFYYIADERVDFRQLIKVLAETFRIRIEMKQIGARQEAGRIGGIGPCGRELCCSAWMSNFSSVSTVAARYQEVSMNPQKLAGQCSKLKCCLNYEVDSYIDEQRKFPPKQSLTTTEGEYIYLKCDVFKRIYWYTLNNNAPSAQIPLPVERVDQIIKMNKRGQKPDTLIDINSVQVIKDKPVEHDYNNVVGQDSLTRFDKPRNDSKNKRKGRKQKPYNRKTDKPDSHESKNRQGNRPQNAGGDKRKQNTNNKQRRYKKPRPGGANNQRQNNTKE